MSLTQSILSNQNDVIATINVLGQAFEVAVITETPIFNTIYFFIIITRVYRYDNSIKLIATSFLERPTWILFQRLSWNQQPIGRSQTLEEVILHQLTPVDNTISNDSFCSSNKTNLGGRMNNILIYGLKIWKERIRGIIMKYCKSLWKSMKDNERL